MSRKMLLIAVPTMACLLTLCVVDGSSQAFAKGPEMGHGPVVTNGRGFGRDFHHDFRHFDRYGWNYGSYSYGYEYPVYETVTPVYTTYETVTPVCTSCDSVYFGSNYGWGYNRFHNDHNPPRRFQPLSERGGMGRRG
jgi:hypothetical protein